MKHISILLLALAGLLTLAACGDSETYADKRKRERAIISQYLIDQHIKVISEAQFKAQGYTTDTLQHEFVMFENSGVYMQIMRPGVGSVLGKNESANVLVRYTERNPNGVAKIKLIVPSTQGTAVASGNVTPSLFTISFQRES